MNEDKKLILLKEIYVKSVKRLELELFESNLNIEKDIKRTSIRYFNSFIKTIDSLL